LKKKNHWKPNDQLNYIEISYNETLKESGMLSPLNEKDNDITLKAISIGLERIVMKTGQNE
jgi:hypothetical protein